MPRHDNAPGWRLVPIGLLTAAVGLVLFAYTVRQAGPDEITRGLGDLGWGFALILLLSTVRELARSQAWVLCVFPPHRLRFRQALAARITGEALGNLTPFGVLLSEPAKAVLVRRQLPVGAAFAAVAAEQIIYGFSAILIMIVGLLALLYSFTLPEALRLETTIALATMAGLAGVALLIIWRAPKLVTSTIEWLAGSGLPGGRLLERQIEHVRTLESRFFAVFAQSGKSLLALSLLEGLFHAAAILEVYVTLALISENLAPTLLTTFILESVNRLITVVFKFVPLRLGVDEAGSGLVAQIIGFGTATGVTLAIIRKARVLVWTAIGVTLLVRRGVSVRDVLREVGRAGGEHGPSDKE